MIEGRILVIDSGQGGLSYTESVMNEISNLSLNFTIDYLADNLAFPYGKKSQKELELHFESLAKLLSQISPPYDFIIIACNTASIYGYKFFQQYFKEEQIVVTTPSLFLQDTSYTKPFYLLATTATCQIYEKNKNVIIIPSDDLVDWIETYNYHLTLQKKTIYLTNFWNNFLSGIEKGTLILGCTHFLHVKNIFLAINHSSDLSIVDTRVKVASTVCKRIEPNKHQYLRGVSRFGTLYITRHLDGDRLKYKKIAGAYHFEFSNTKIL